VTRLSIVPVLLLSLLAPVRGLAAPPDEPAAPEDPAEPDEGSGDEAAPSGQADPGDKPPEVDADEPVAPSARPILDRLAAATSAEERRKAVDELTALTPTPIPELAAFLDRTRASAEADRRRLLAEKGYDVPDDKGKFSSPGRQTDKEEKTNDQLDWLTPLYDMPASPALTDIILDLAVMRALAASKSSKGAAAIIHLAFEADGVAYRDECGRFLRRMSPWSLPALIRAAESPSGRNADKSRARYARYQLERLDRESPRKALNDAPTDALQVEILHTFADSQYREAVFVVLDTVDHVSPKVRQAAREAWMEYATGRDPRPAPKQKLQLPGGKLSEEEVPLWLNHRELADIAIRRRLEELTGKKPPAKATLADLSKQIFAVHDRRRAERLDKEMAAGLEQAGKGDLAAAGARFDAILVQVPDYARRGEMASTYLALGDQLEKASKWREAATAFGKAHAVAPAGPSAEEALSRHHRARGQGLAAEGKKEVAAAEMARATEIDRAVDRRVEQAGRGDRSWMLVTGIAVGLAGVLLLGMGLAWRRRAWRTWRG
jgi:hypothetical protein